MAEALGIEEVDEVRKTMVLIGVVVALVAGVSVASANIHPVDPRERFASVDDLIEDEMRAHGVLGVSVAIVDDFEVVYARGFGFAEPGRRVGTGTLFQAASLSKPVSVVVAAAAAQGGLIDLEADVTGMLTSWRLPPMPYPGPITLRMLFAHRAGVNVHGFPGYRLDEQLPGLPQILDGIRGKNEPIRVVAEPGAQHVYSGGGYLIAQLAIEDHTGLTWEDLADTLVLEPLGLELSTYRVLREPDRSQVAVGYRPDGAEVAGGGWHLYPETAAASLWTTPTEYAAFLIDVMRSYHSGTGVSLNQETAQLLLDPDFFMGFGVSREEGGIAIGHDGANEGYRCGFLAVPHLGDGVVVMTNNDTGDALTAAVIGVVADELGWPWTGWSTPFWVVLLVFVSLVLAASLMGYSLNWGFRHWPALATTTGAVSEPSRRRRGFVLEIAVSAVFTVGFAALALRQIVFADLPPYEQRAPGYLTVAAYLVVAVAILLWSVHRWAYQKRAASLIPLLLIMDAVLAVGIIEAIF